MSSSSGPKVADSVLEDHYNKVSSSYDKYLQIHYHVPCFNMIKHYIPLTKNDQIVEIGGGTGELIRLLREDLGIETPGVCVDPNSEMLKVAMKKDGIITVESTAEDFLKTKPEYPLKVVLIVGAVHFFHNLEEVFSALAKYMPDDGICLVTVLRPYKQVWFEAALKKGIKWMDLTPLYKILDSNNLHRRTIQWKESVEIDKQFWYETLRNRYSIRLCSLTDEEIEEGILELEQTFGADKTLKFDCEIDGVLITKKEYVMKE